VRRDTEGTVLLAVAAVVFNLVFSGAFQSYVRTGLGVPLLASAVLLAAVGLPAVFRRTETEAPDTEDLLDHDHVHGNLVGRVGLVMLLPVLTVFLIAPAPLGAFVADRGDQNRSVSGATTTGLAPLGSPVQGAVEASVREFLLRAYHEPEQVEGVRLRIIGFVVPHDDLDDGYLLTRFTFSCCAADALPLQIALTGVSTVPPIEQWMTVEGMWEGDFIELEEDLPVPFMVVQSQMPAERPQQPYDY
jgi:uncharacterized repeat protein (TIGR03943 family)